MTMPSSGAISMSQINTELGRAANTQISLDTAENGGYATINVCSTNYPVSGNPAAISEWYGYDHAAACLYIVDVYNCLCTLDTAGVIVSSDCVGLAGWYQLTSGVPGNIVSSTTSGTPTDTITNCTNYGSCANTPCI